MELIISKMTRQNQLLVMLATIIIAFAAVISSEAPQETYSTNCPACELEWNEPCFDPADGICHPGQHINYDRTCNNTERENARSCCPCVRGRYQPKFNHCKCCIICTNCTEDGKEEVSPCNATQDAICRKPLPPSTTQEGATSATTTTTVRTTTDASHNVTTDVPLQGCDKTGFIVLTVTATLVFAGIGAFVVFVLTSAVWICKPQWAQRLNDRLHPYLSVVCTFVAQCAHGVVGQITVGYRIVCRAVTRCIFWDGQHGLQRVDLTEENS